MDQEKFEGAGEEERSLPQEIESLIRRNQATLKRIDGIVDQMKATQQHQNGRDGEPS